MMAPGEGGSGSQEVDLNLAPIIDAFTVLIAFMLASASFLAIGILDAGINGKSAKASKQKKPPISIQVKITRATALKMSVKGKLNRKKTFKASSGEPDLKALTRELAALKKRYPGVSTMVISAEDDVPYETVIRTMNESRKHMPSVLLGGF